MHREYELDVQKEIEKMPITELIGKIRDWEKEWSSYIRNGIKPPNLTDFLDILNTEFEVKKRVPNDTAN